MSRSLTGFRAEMEKEDREVLARVVRELKPARRSNEVPVQGAIETAFPRGVDYFIKVGSRWFTGATPGEAALGSSYVGSRPRAGWKDRVAALELARTVGGEVVIREEVEA